MDPAETILGDLNGTIASLLRDYSDVQESPQRRWGYKRAANAVRDLDEPIESLLLPDGTLRKVPYVGPASARIILEVLRSGSSPTVEAALRASTQAQQIEERRTQRDHFLTRAQAKAVLERPSATELRRAYRGDLQMHSTWSDGSQTLEEIVTSRLDRGYAFSAITDHSYGLPIARGLSMARVAEQHREIDQLNDTYQGRFRLLKGIECNIRTDGTVDMRPDELRLLEIVVAAPHSALRSTADQTSRLITAVATPGVHILGHPRGRMYGSRTGLHVRWPAVFAAAVEAGVAIEIDGDRSRQDLDYTVARQALDAGCLLAVDTDAHSVADMDYVDIALAHAVLAGAGPEHVVNCWPLDRLLEWSRRRAVPV